MKQPNSIRLIQNYFVVLIFMWTAAVGGSLIWTISTAKKNTLITALAQGRMALEKDKMFRRWASKHGGVYTFTSTTIPNPYLSHIKDRDIKLPDGRTLTLINPAYMVRQMYEFNKNANLVRTRLVSDKLLNPVNVPDGWEVEALEKVLKTGKDYYIMEKSSAKYEFKLMAPFFIEKPCLKCHAFQGYKVGDIRGAISVVTNITDIIDGEKDIEKSAYVGHIILYVLILILFRIGYLNIVRMLTRANEREEVLNAAMSRSESILQSASESIFGVDRLGSITFINNALSKTLKYTSEELVGKNHILLTHKRDEQGMPVESPDCIILKAIGTLKPLNCVETFVRKDGTEFFGEMFASPIVLDGKATGAVVSFFDITERIAKDTAIAKALQEKDILLSELHHRVKNNLQIVSGILSLQADTADSSGQSVEDILKNAQSRVMSMALMHDCLYKSEDLSTVDMADYFAKLIDYYSVTFTHTGSMIKFDTDIDKLDLPISSTITCGLLINELVTNSIKHAFAETEFPAIRISLKEDRGNAILTVSDNGKGLDENAKEKDSLGMMLIHSLTEQLYGKLTFENANGLTTVITFPTRLQKS
ncbi:histidine kinase dimerization/phosphoacceptor domain -containing protein [Seleniivibrio woodruffii]|uniref:histidine kinase dimerization/phosphoacceptor domain -containing protein n=1 Tax=Seleniivibrio woodruffii TaxID=1078050 RepID=UPI0026F13987|nr:histidine kinase dimerization/phosphoacceptor domain -containing protein [Seleniivibrio woodruffii]